MVVFGEVSFTATTVSYQTSAPLSFSSSRFTEVITACFTCINKMASATRRGSSVSYSFGRPVATAQKVQLRVQTFPKIMKVAVPSPQHSPIFGQLPDWQIVCNLYSSTKPRTFLKFSPIGNLTLSQSGRRLRCSVLTTGNSIIV